MEAMRRRDSVECFGLMATGLSCVEQALGVPGRARASRECEHAWCMHGVGEWRRHICTVSESAVLSEPTCVRCAIPHDGYKHRQGGYLGTSRQAAGLSLHQENVCSLGYIMQFEAHPHVCRGQCRHATSWRRSRCV